MDCVMHLCSDSTVRISHSTLMPEFTLNINGRDVIASVDDPANAASVFPA